MKTVGKFACQSVKTYEPNYAAREYEFFAVCNDGTPENDRFHKYTPSGSIKIVVDNPDVVFVPGKRYYVEFTEVV